MGISSVIHYGTDRSCRIPLLRFTGFEVAECPSMMRLRELLQDSEFDAILLAETPTCELIRVCRRLSTGPLIYFATEPAAMEDSYFDLVIEPVTRPEEWLESIRTLVEESRRIRAASDRRSVASVPMRADSAAVRLNSRAKVQGARDARKPKL